MAVLKIDADRPLPFVTLSNSDNLQVGDVVFAVGNPLGIGKTVTMGIISATMKSELGVLDEAGSYENLFKRMLLLIQEIQEVLYLILKGDLSVLTLQSFPKLAQV